MTKEVESALAKYFQVVFTNRVPSAGPLKLEKTKNKFTARNNGNLRSGIIYLKLGLLKSRKMTNFHKNKKQLWNLLRQCNKQ